VSVLAGDEILVVAAAQGTGQYALTTSPGQRLPIHAGAAGKLLLAHLPRAEIDLRLSRKLAALTAKTIAEPKRMLAELARIRQRGWSFDQGEQMSGVHAVAAPIRDASDMVVAAISVPFVAGVEQVQVDEIRRLVIAAALAISTEIARVQTASKADAGTVPVVAGLDETISLAAAPSEAVANVEQNLS
jgi:DNA-binding IclR family transcriptional regulator